MSTPGASSPPEPSSTEIPVDIEGPPCPEGITLSTYQGEHQLEEMMELFDADLSEPYSVFTYRYFLDNWPGLCIMVRFLRAMHCQLRHAASH